MAFPTAKPIESQPTSCCFLRSLNGRFVPEAEVNLGFFNVSFGGVVYQGATEASYIGGRVNLSCGESVVMLLSAFF